MAAEEPVTPTSSGTPAFKLNTQRWSQTDRIVGIATLVLFISLFLSWFGAHYGIYGATVDGLYHGYMYLTLIVSLALLAFYVARAGFEHFPVKLPIADAQVVVIGTSINAVLTIISFLTKPSGTSWQFGAYIGLIAAIIAVAPRLIPTLLARRAASRTAK
jgi:hypothetical protein